MEFNIQPVNQEEREHGEAYLLLTASAQRHPVTSAHILLVRPGYMALPSQCKELEPKLSYVQEEEIYWVNIVK